MSRPHWPPRPPPVTPTLATPPATCNASNGHPAPPLTTPLDTWHAPTGRPATCQPQLATLLPVASPLAATPPVTPQLPSHHLSGSYWPSNHLSSSYWLPRHPRATCHAPIGHPARHMSRSHWPLSPRATCHAPTGRRRSDSRHGSIRRHAAHIEGQRV